MCFQVHNDVYKKKKQQQQKNLFIQIVRKI